MKAIVHDRYGAPGVLRLDEVDRPVPAGDQVLVRVRAASVNARDWHFMRGDPYLARLMAPGLGGLRRPKLRIRGTDFAGVVEAVGRDVPGLRVGDEVYGEAHGAFAEYVCAPANAVDRKPDNLSFEQAAAVPLAGVTALVGLRDLGRLRPGQPVLINGASGGMGTFAVQLAKVLGGVVTAVCSTRNVDLVRSLGADHVVDYSRQDFTRAGQRYDLVFDLVGNRSLTELRRTLTRDGTLLISGGGTSDGGSLVGPMGLAIKGLLLNRFVRHRLLLLNAVPGRETLAALREHLESGTIDPIIDRTYPLADVPEAIRYVEQEHARAKVVISL